MASMPNSYQILGMIERNPNKKCASIARDVIFSPVPVLVDFSALRRHGSISSGRSVVCLKVKGLISNMIKTLQNQANKEAQKKAYCDAEMKATHKKNDDLNVPYGVHKKTLRHEKVITLIRKMHRRKMIDMEPFLIGILGTNRGHRYKFIPKLPGLNMRHIDPSIIFFVTRHA